MMARNIGLVVGALAIVAGVFGAIVDLPTFLRSYLWVYLFWLGWALGSMATVMIHHLSGGGWGFGVRRIGEAAAMTLPLLAVLFVPILLGSATLFPWANPGTVAGDQVMQHRAGAYTLFWFTFRAAIYFAIWIATAIVLRRWSVAQDDARNGAAAGYTARFQKFCGIGLILYAFTVSLAAIDWVMTLEPHWYSTIFGILTIVSQVLTGFAFVTLAATILSRRQNLLGENMGAQNLHDLGNLTFAFLLLWAYMAFSQFLITWSGNSAYEAPWYIHRNAGGWWHIATAVILVHFFLPFVLLLFGGLKKRANFLSGIVIIVLLARLLESYWFVEPAFYQHGLHFGWMDAVLPFAVGVPCLALWAFHLGRASLLPMRDPRMLLEPEAA